MSYHHCYKYHRFSTSAWEIVSQAEKIINAMQLEGYNLTLRQLYYQFVHRNWLVNEEKEYKRLGRILTRAREGGYINWLAIEDRGRSVHRPQIIEDVPKLISELPTLIVFDFWDKQPYYIEVWIEKQALEGIIERPCKYYQVNYLACKGYLSASEAWRAGRRFKIAIDKGKTPILIHLADHDPSGLNMTDDNRSRLHLFAEDSSIRVKRIALNIDQVHKYNPPTNPTKESDNRSAEYIRKYGVYSWELDALSPHDLTDLISSTITKYIDIEAWEKVKKRQDETRQYLTKLYDKWGDILLLLRG